MRRYRWDAHGKLLGWDFGAGQASFVLEDDPHRVAFDRPPEHSIVANLKAADPSEEEVERIAAREGKRQRRAVPGRRKPGPTPGKHGKHVKAFDGVQVLDYVSTYAFIQDHPSMSTGSLGRRLSNEPFVAIERGHLQGYVIWYDDGRPVPEMVRLAYEAKRKEA